MHLRCTYTCCRTHQLPGPCPTPILTSQWHRKLANPHQHHCFTAHSSVGTRCPAHPSSAGLKPGSFFRVNAAGRKHPGEAISRTLLSTWALAATVRPREENARGCTRQSTTKARLRDRSLGVRPMSLWGADLHRSSRTALSEANEPPSGPLCCSSCSCPVRHG